MIHLLLALIYLSFISLGLPDALLGSAWPVMSEAFHVSIENVGIINLIIAGGTIISSLLSDRMTKKLGVGTITIVSVFVTAIALVGFATSPSFLVLCLWAIPYGLGGGSIDAALNNYVAVHYESRHMSWLHCMWGVGATVGPYIMGTALSYGHGYQGGYYGIFMIQAVLGIVLLFNRKAWKSSENEQQAEEIKNRKVLSLKDIICIKGVPQILIAFFCFCSIEQTTGLFASSYLVSNRGVSVELAATYASLFYLGITVGRAISGFFTMKFTDIQMIRGGQAVMFIGMIIVLCSQSSAMALIGILIIGFGSAPVYPCIIHSTPTNFGVVEAQAITGVQMASAYTGSMLTPFVFGFIAKYIGVGVYPIYLLIILICMFIMYEWLLKELK